MGNTIGVIEEISEELSVEWVIPNFSSLLDGSDNWYASPVFRLGDERWRLEMRPNWETEARNPASGWVLLNLCRIDGGPPSTFCCFVGIRGSGGVEKSREGEKEFVGHGYYAWDDFCSRSYLLEHRTRLMPEDTLTIRCVLKKPVTAREPIKTPQQRVENYESELEDHKKQISTLESEKLSIAEEYKCLFEGKLTIEKVNEQLKKEVETLMEQNKDLNEICEEQTHNISKASSELRKASIDDDAVEKNNNYEDHEESKNKKNVKQLSQVKSIEKSIEVK